MPEIPKRNLAMSVTAMLQELLIRKKSAIVDRWVKIFLGYYPAESLKFLASQKDRFANPIGYTISSSAGAIFDELIGESESGMTEALLKDVISIRAVQGFSPSQAVRFVFDLKGAIRSEIKREIGWTDCRDELEVLESRIDNLVLIAFDSYMESRERLFRIRINEIKARSLEEAAENSGIQNDSHVKRDD